MKETLELIISQGSCLGISCPQCPLYKDCDSEVEVVEIAKNKLEELER